MREAAVLVVIGGLVWAGTWFRGRHRSRGPSGVDARRGRVDPLAAAVAPLAFVAPVHHSELLAAVRSAVTDRVRPPTRPGGPVLFERQQTSQTSLVTFGCPGVPVFRAVLRVEPDGLASRGWLSVESLDIGLRAGDVGLHELAMLRQIVGEAVAELGGRVVPERRRAA